MRSRVQRKRHKRTRLNNSQSRCASGTDLFGPHYAFLGAASAKSAISWLGALATRVCPREANFSLGFATTRLDIGKRANSESSITFVKMTFVIAGWRYHIAGGRGHS